MVAHSFAAVTGRRGGLPTVSILAIGTLIYTVGTMKSLVSVVIPCYNQGRYLDEAIASTIDQDYPAIEVIVVDDGSTDETPEVAARWVHRITYLRQPNAGVSAARNRGVRAARGEVIALLDSDDILLPHAVTRRIAILDRRPDVGFVCGEAILFDQAGESGLKSSQSGQPRHVNGFRWETVEYCATISTVMMRRRAFDAANGFDESLAYAEDWLLWVQLSRLIEMVYLPEPVARYRLHPASATMDVARMNTINRQAAAKAVESSHFPEYPANFRAKLLYYRFATAWRLEPKTTALGFLVRAFATDPLQVTYGLRVIKQGLTNTLARRRRA